ncbi:sugar phosphate isomerase/epimerase family protein [Hespellia stercorisuis]|uniref:Sugar phosphate isomerase/epimerase n=1 Tax=Hespellia stercorisuis DSM 15480 TaxID=1121950 RepID=A0A1M6RCJ2_9FIRM|nr:sugar phosphate isomerase/epimerase [Hespellia stercorisuis]SHK30162.1 Sugar phosphate isomerase/epimerase [Hespellia stercorisuis DSM 15480]
MKVGFCVVNYSEKPLEEVVDIAASNGYEAVELPSYTDNGQVDMDEMLKGDNAKKMKKMIEDRGLFISSLSNHADSPLIMGPYSAGMDSICPGTKEEKIKFGTESMIRSAQLANLLEVPAVVAFSGMENYGHINDWPEPNGWKCEEEQFAEKWGYVLDKYKEYGVKVAFEPHPNNIVYDTQSTLRLLDVVDHHESFAINLDPANILFSGVDVNKFAYELRGRIAVVHAKDCEIVKHNLAKGGLNMYMQDGWGRLDRSFRFRIPGWGDVDWKRLISELFLTGYDYVFNYEHEDVIMSRADGTKKTIDFLRPLMIDAPYEGRNDKLFTK